MTDAAEHDAWRITDGRRFITVQFHDGPPYLYTNASAGAGNIAQAQTLARGGRGLNSYINTHMKKLYAAKL